jgi:Tfp pilus assembly protein PilN
MAVTLNLLPVNNGTSGTIGKILKTTRMVGIIGIALFLISAILVSALFLLTNSTLNSLNSDIATLETQIKSQQKVEQQVALLKDRLGKIKSVLKTPEALAGFDNVSPIVDNIGSSSYINDLNIDSNKIEVSGTFGSTSDVTNFIKSLSSTDKFLTIEMASFNYSSKSGYQVSANITQK